MMIRVKIYLLILLFLQAGTRSEAQVCNNDTSFSCLINCFNLKAIIPDVRSTDDYSVISIPYCPYDFVTNAPAITPNCISFDDKYIDTTILPFRFCFYGQTYGKVIIGTNALITFDSLMALRGNNYTLTGNPIPFGGAGSIGSGNCPQPSGVNYPRASIFGAYSDIFPRSSDNFKIETRTIGVAPARIFIVSFSNVSMYGCTSQKFTSQIVIYEGTGVIDVHVQEKPTCAVTNANRAIIGIQNYARDMGVAAPGRNCQPFTATNESWRFTPNAGVSRYNRVELYKNGTLVNTGTAVSVGNSKMEATFTNVCQPETNASYVVKAYYQDCRLPGEESEFHTQINVNKTAGPITATITPASCASNMGTITVTDPVGPTLEYSINGFTWQSSNLFSVTPGTYSVRARIVGSSCLSTRDVVVGTLGTLSASATGTPASCSGNTGSITVNASGGTAPYTYSINGGPFQASNVFTNLAASNYNVLVRDATNCNFNFAIIVGTSASSITASAATTNASCASPNGSITITPAAGTAPYSYTLNGGASQTSNVFSNLAAGAYTIVVTDAAGCSFTFSVSVNGSAGISASATTTNASCGSATGSITVTPAAGTAPYSYRLNGGASQTSNIFSNLAAGTYTILVTDATGCSFTFNVTVNGNSGITATAATTNANCGAATGSITVSPLAGTTPYSYTLNGGPSQTSNVFSNLNTGTYSIVVTDASACSFTFTATVNGGSAITATAAATNSNCPGSATGTITITPSLGIAPYSYTLNGGASQTSNIFSNLVAGNYAIVVTDAAGCNFNFSTAVNSGAGITATAATTNSACGASATGSITVTPSAGTSPYSYTLNGGTSQPSNLFSNLIAGLYTILVTDAAGCNFTLTATINSGSGITATVSSTNTNCPGSATGSITITPASGVTPYAYTLNGGTPQASNIFSNLLAGSYVIVVTDANGCSFSFSSAVSNGAGISATATTANAACSGSASGTVTVTPSGGIAPYTYSIDGGAFQASNVFTAQSAGVHNIIVRDAANCSFSFTATVSNGSGITATATTTNTNCSGSATGSITVNPAAGASPYSYTLNGGASQTSNLFSNLIAGSYAIVVTDATGCSFSFTAVVSNGSGVSATAATTNTSCSGSASGTVTITPAGGIAPYTYSIDGGTFQASNVFTGQSAGIHNIIVRDAGNCNFSFTATVSNGSGITASATTTTTNCAGSATGSISITAASGAAPYSYTLNGGASQTSNLFLNLLAGSYAIVVTDATGCSFGLTAMVSNGSGISATALTTNTSCPGSASGSITITPSNGTGPYSFAIDGGSFQASNIFSGLLAGPHNITVRDAGNCSFSFTATVSGGSGISATATTTNTDCAGASTGSIAITPALGAIPYSYTLNGGASQTSNLFSNLPAGAYTIVVTDAANCQFTFNTTVNNGSGIMATASAINSSCAGLSSGSITITPASGVSPFSYTLNGGASQTSNVFSNLAAGSYALVVTDANGCNFSFSSSVGNGAGISAFAGKDTIAAIGIPHQLFGSGGLNYSFTWMPARSLNNAFIPNPVATIFTDTRFTLIVEDSSGCKGYDTVDIKVYEGPTYYIPTAFTPNGDGLNDIFRPTLPAISKTEYFRVFNRWGKMIFTSNQNRHGWDGTYQGKEQQVGAYAWIIRGEDKFGKIVEQKGTVVLLK